MTTVVGILFFSLSSYLGWKGYNVYIVKTRILDDIESFLRYTVSEILNFKRSFGEISRNYPFKTKELKDAIVNKNGDVVGRYLDKAEGACYNEIFLSMDKLGYGELINRLNLLVNDFHEYLIKSRENVEKQGKLRLKMGFLIGIAVFIVLV